MGSWRRSKPHGVVTAVSAALVASLACLVAFAGELDEASQTEPPITEAQRRHWAFRSLSDPTPPAVRDPRHVRNAIDRFIQARLETRGVAPGPEADRATLIRRLAFDVTGLPPTPDEVAAFVGDTSPDAWERLVDRYLGSPAYGERQGQHWLDLARFAETDGFEHDNLRPNAWRYRDWVIDALNADMTYDEFVALQLAGDVLRPDDVAAVVATGFALCGPDMPDINLQDERRHMVLNEMTATIGSVFLGLRMGCAQCHEHKSDPISQADFYRLRAFFDQVEIFEDHPLPAQDLTSAEASPSEDKRPKGRVLRAGEGERRPSHLMVRGDFARKGPRVAPAIPRVTNVWDISASAAIDAGGSSDGADESPRTVLTRWLTRPDHPLVTRVIVNRLWQHHFGRGLVATPSDFGKLGELPTHPELLDWLAGELPRLDWSLKRLHRLILTSAAYRRASRAPADAAGTAWQRARELDPDNMLLWRQNRTRLDAEAIRDGMLSVAGRLSSRRSGPGVMPPLPEEVRKSIRKDHWKVSPDVEDHHRRSVYLFVRRNLRYPFFEVFDRPDTNASCARRSQTTIAPQSLALLNSDLAVDASRHFAGRVLNEAGRDSAAQVDTAYRLALGRSPTARERELGGEFVAALAQQLEGRDVAELATPLPPAAGSMSKDDARGAALTSLCLSLYNLNEFVYVD